MTTQTAMMLDGNNGVWALHTSTDLSVNLPINFRVGEQEELKELIVERTQGYLTTIRRTTKESLCINYYQVSEDRENNNFHLVKSGEIQVFPNSREYDGLSSRLEAVA